MRPQHNRLPAGTARGFGGSAIDRSHPLQFRLDGRLISGFAGDTVLSAALACGAGVMAVVLTGMGDDGLVGARAVHHAGGILLTEHESSCVVYGMPRVVWEAGLSAARAPIDQMAASVVSHL